MLHGRLETCPRGGPLHCTLLSGLHRSRGSPPTSRQNCSLPKVEEPDRGPPEAARMEDPLFDLLAVVGKL